MRAEGAALPAQRRRRRGSWPKRSTTSNTRKILSQPEADPVELVREALEQFLSRNIGARRQRGDLGPGPKRLGAVHQAAAGRIEEDSRHRQVRSPAADSLRAGRRRLGLPADGRRQRGRRLRAGDRSRSVRDEARPGVSRAASRSKTPASKSTSSSSRRWRSTTSSSSTRCRICRRPDEYDPDNPPESMVVLLAGHRHDRPGHHQRLSRLAAQRAARRQPLHQGADQGAEAHVRQGRAPEAQRHEGRRSQGRLPGDAAGVQRSADRSAALDRLLHEHRSQRQDRPRGGAGQRDEAARACRNTCRKTSAIPVAEVESYRGLSGSAVVDVAGLQGEPAQLRRLLRPGAARAGQGQARRPTCCRARSSPIA